MFGKAEKSEILSLKPLRLEEFIVFIPITFLIFFLGLFAFYLLDITHLSVNEILEIVGGAEALNS